MARVAELGTHHGDHHLGLLRLLAAVSELRPASEPPILVVGPRVVGAFLSAENKQQFWVPEGFAHGFCVLSEVAEVQYKARGFWNKGCERAIRWNDPELAIQWPLDQLEGAAVSLSEKDAVAPGFKVAKAAGDLFL